MTRNLAWNQGVTGSDGITISTVLFYGDAVVFIGITGSNAMVELVAKDDRLCRYDLAHSPITWDLVFGKVVKKLSKYLVVLPERKPE